MRGQVHRARRKLALSGTSLTRTLSLRLLLLHLRRSCSAHLLEAGDQIGDLCSTAAARIEALIHHLME